MPRGPHGQHMVSRKYSYLAQITLLVDAGVVEQM
jgi:hypothetical protein